MNDIEKIKNIDNMLKDEELLKNYIQEIEKEEIEIPFNIQKNIINKIGKNKKNNYINICKIAACLIFSLVVCRMDFIKNDEMSDIKIIKNESSIQIQEKISDFYNFFKTPINLERNDK